jgi:carbon-monoxide dehydrogenase medium subunit
MRNISQWFNPESPQEAAQMMRDTKGKGCYLAGGTDLLLENRTDFEFAVDLSATGLNEIARTETGDLFIGSCVTLHDLETSPLTHEFADGAIAFAAAGCGNRPVRSTATVGGNLCNALPSADMVPVLLALDAVVFFTDGESQESVPLSEFFVGPRKTVLDGSLLIGLAISGEYANWKVISRKLTRTVEDISLVQVAVGLEIEGDTILRGSVAMGAVAPTPVRATEAEALLIDLPIADAPVAFASVADLAAATCSPIDDHRATAQYRTDMVEVLTRRLLCEVAGIEDVKKYRGEK